MVDTMSSFVGCINDSQCDNAPATARHDSAGDGISGQRQECQQQVARPTSDSGRSLNHYKLVTLGSLRSSGLQKGSRNCTVRQRRERPRAAGRRLRDAAVRPTEAAVGGAHGNCRTSTPAARKLQDIDHGRKARFSSCKRLVRRWMVAVRSERLTIDTRRASNGHRARPALEIVPVSASWNTY